MRKILTRPVLALTLLFVTIHSYAQTPKFQWGKRGGSGGSDYSGSFEHVIDMAADAHGNVYVLALNSSSLANIDGHNGIGVRDKLSLASWDCNGNFRWMKNYGSASVFYGTALATDTLGGVYMTGETISNNSLGYSYFDTDTTLGNTNAKMYIIKYDTSGNFQWLKMPEPATVPYNALSSPIDMSVAPNGDIYWLASLETGSYDGNAYTVPAHEYCMVKYNKNGIYQSMFPLDVTTTDGGNTANLYGAYNVSVSHLVRDHNSGAFYLAGTFDRNFGTLTFGTTSIHAASNVVGAYPVYIAAFNASGNSLWTKQSDSVLYANTFTCRPVLDEQGNIYIAGGVQANNSFLGHTFVTPTNGMTPFAVSVSSNGTLNWASNANVPTAGTKVCAIAYRNNTVALAGLYGGILTWDTDTITAPITMAGTNYIFLTRLNAGTGAEISMDSIASEGTLDNVPTAMTSDRRGNFYVGGLFDYILYPGQDTIVSVGGWYDWFVAKFGTANCGCINPAITFTDTANGTGVHFHTTINTAVDSVVWDFGDGTHGTGNNPNHTYAHGGNYHVCVTAYNSCGNNTSCQTITISGTGISNTPGFEQIDIYPNPATQKLTVRNAMPGTLLAVYDVNGRLILQQQLQLPAEFIEVSQLSPGMYFIRMISSEGKQAQTKFIKQ
ncbi:T9SS type A sorting domain-containing protein [Chitinophagaceae bacterium MMS25-I14]